MTVVLIFLLLLIVTSLWWLKHQRLMSKPWLESGLDNIEYGTDHFGLPKAKIGLLVFLAVVGMLFTLFFSGHFMRQEIEDWRPMPLPPVVWINGILLLAASIYLQAALIVARRQNRELKNASPIYHRLTFFRFEESSDVSIKHLLLYACVLTVAFLVGQLVAWQSVANDGFLLSGNPANSFFYVLTGLHALHILGGLIALFSTSVISWNNPQSEKLLSRIDLCALYWHFLFFIWCTMIFVMLGWTYDPLIELCQRVIS
jgi:cytochrome c oxidase subunit III